MSIFKRSHKWKIRAGYLLIAFSLISLYNQHKKVLTSCAVSVSTACVHAHSSFKQALTGFIIGLALLAYGYVRRFRSNNPNVA
jgi:hypothetical protein